jgi:hypothetical protein
MLPEERVVLGGVGGCEVSAPIEDMLGEAAAALAAAARVDPVLRLVEETPALVQESAPIRLTAAMAVAAAATAELTWSGAALRRAREGRGVSLSQMADRTKVTRHHLENIEEDRFDRLPSYVYLRGILISLAKELRLEEQTVCRSYLQLVRQAGEARPH